MGHKCCKLAPATHQPESAAIGNLADLMPLMKRLENVIKFLRRDRTCVQAATTSSSWTELNQADDLSEHVLQAHSQTCRRRRWNNFQCLDNVDLIKSNCWSNLGFHLGSIHYSFTTVLLQFIFTTVNYIKYFSENPTVFFSVVYYRFFSKAQRKSDIWWNTSCSVTGKKFYVSHLVLESKVGPNSPHITISKTWSK